MSEVLSVVPSPATAQGRSLRDAPTRYRMRDLCRESGMSRQAIHYYIQQGLLPEGEKAGRNMAYYGPEHIARLQTIKRLQHEHFLPLKAIRALLDGKADDFSPAQRRLLAALKPRLASLDAEPSGGTPGLVPLAVMAAEVGVPTQDVERLVELGLVAGVPGADGLRVSRGDREILSLFAQLRAAGFTEELGFGAQDLAIYEQGLGQIFGQEKDLLLARLSHLPPERVSELLLRGLPVIHAILVCMHKTLVRRFFAGVG